MRELRLELEGKIEAAKDQARADRDHVANNLKQTQLNVVALNGEYEKRFDVLERERARISGRDAVIVALVTILISALVTYLLRQNNKPVAPQAIPTVTVTATAQASPTLGPAVFYRLIPGPAGPPGAPGTTSPSPSPSPSPSGRPTPLPSPAPSNQPVICLYLMNGGPICV